MALTEYQSELAEWLGSIRGWSTVATWTFGKAWPDGPSPDAVRRHVCDWITRQELAPAYVVAEAGTSGERRWHAHGLLGTHPLGIRPRRRELWADWHRRYGRCRFEPVLPTGGIHHYVSKYITKAPDEWWITNDGTWH